MKFSSVPVLAECDLCKKTRKIPYKNHRVKSTGGYFCKSCRQITKKSIKELEEEFYARNYRLLSTSYKNASTYLEYECLKHPGIISRLRYTDFKAEKGGCNRCGIERTTQAITLAHTEVYSYFLSKNYELMTTYTRGDAKLTYRCLLHPEYTQTTTYTAVHSGRGGCSYCRGGRITHTQIKDEFSSRGLTLLNEFVESTNERLYFTCAKHQAYIQDTSWNTFRDWGGCRYCGIEKRSSSNNYRWAGGISSLSSKLRMSLSLWKSESRIHSNYTCVVCGIPSGMVHHLKSFSVLVSDSLKIADLPIYKDASSYSKEELRTLGDILSDLHWKYPLGVCLCYEHHKEFHSIYGSHKNEPSQFYEYYVNKTGVSYL